MDQTEDPTSEVGREDWGDVISSCILYNINQWCSCGQGEASMTPEEIEDAVLNAAEQLHEQIREGTVVIDARGLMPMLQTLAGRRIIDAYRHKNTRSYPTPIDNVGAIVDPECVDAQRLLERKQEVSAAERDFDDFVDFLLEHEREEEAEWCYEVLTCDDPQKPSARQEALGWDAKKERNVRLRVQRQAIKFFNRKTDRSKT